MTEQHDEHELKEQQLYDDMFQFIESIESRFHVELKSLFNARRYSYTEFMAEFRQRMVEGLNAYDGFSNEDGSDTAFSYAAVEVEPNIFISRYNALVVRNYGGQKLVDWVQTVLKSLEAMMSSTTPAAFAAQTLGGALLAVGAPMAVATIKNLWAGEALKGALTLAVRKVGLGSAIAAAATAAASILYFLLVSNPKKIIGLVLNDTDTNYYVPDWRKSVNGYYGGNLYMEHGTTERFMMVPLTDKIDSPEIQLKARQVAKNDDETMVAAGIFFAEKRVGFYGAEGVFVFTPYPGHGNDSAFAYQFAVPYSRDNRTNIDVHASGRIDNRAHISKLFRDMYNAARVNVEKQAGNMSMTANVNDARGGRVYGVGCVSTPLTYPK
ncbi:hypothetical protein ACFONN_19030 [Dyella humi]|uniref:Uncharacterized protein n=1 Tax=Dyella humi TaxID=1770547 RepID=A0ABW8IEA1_9GAMM